MGKMDVKSVVIFVPIKTVQECSDHKQMCVFVYRVVFFLNCNCLWTKLSDTDEHLRWSQRCWAITPCCQGSSWPHLEGFVIDFDLEDGSTSESTNLHGATSRPRVLSKSADYVMMRAAVEPIGQLL